MLASMVLWLAALTLVLGTGIGVAMFGVYARRNARNILAAADTEAQLMKRSAKHWAQARHAEAETEGKEVAAEIRAKLDEHMRRGAEALAERENDLVAEESRVASRLAAAEGASDELDQRYAAMREQNAAAKALKHAARDDELAARTALEARAQETSADAVSRLHRTWLEDARSDAANAVRAIEQTASDPIWGIRAQRMMNIAVSRYRNHFLTERPVSNLPVSGAVAELLTRDDSALLNTLQEVANVTLTMHDSGKGVRLEGLDGVGREVARRALARLNKKPQSHREAQREPVSWTQKIRQQLEQEITGLGKKAFTVLKIKRPHPEIVGLVGRLNYRTSFTQNQWLHAVEASFLAGMMAEEMGLSRRLARRATLLHDIGKALTHEMDGSHAVIGADIARRLGEKEVVANAIGAHHADEPPTSVYAYLVAGADAMSGARPGARREHDGGFSTKLQDLERIGRSYRGVQQCFAVHGGRELRVYVREGEVSDLQAVEMSSNISLRVSEEMTFPGQIKVTVIRATEAVAIAS